MEMETCPVCQRKIKRSDMTNHHWLPKCEGGTEEHTMRICKTCHDTLHYVIPIEQVKYFTTVRQLENHWIFGHYIKWIRNKKHSSMYKVKKILKHWFPKIRIRDRNNNRKRMVS